ncbi:CesT family type III secretion system chaperone [Hyphomicrobium sp. MC1]|uniref:CesT family type III secretion system chaperone n=1 Tax=Hyphomicrobium sp. (strain MC1) TaxID=717785 RepID=UPI000213ED96|nr:CesT family type III secretion system chaperone [Hyphomicrobium sp. MC1]CCB66646.1 protein of unknown function [Hyphomicrobium sp. MC1]
MQSTIDMVDALLGDLSEALGERIALDDSGRCGLVFSGEIEIIIEFVPDEEQLTFCSEILRPRPEDYACFRAALAMNYGRLPAGVWIALDSKTGIILLYAALPIRGVGGEAVLKLVGRLVDLSQTLREELSLTPFVASSPGDFSSLQNAGASIVRG